MNRQMKRAKGLRVLTSALAGIVVGVAWSWLIVGCGSTVPQTLEVRNPASASNTTPVRPQSSFTGKPETSVQGSIGGEAIRRADASDIPYEDILRYPEDWPDSAGPTLSLRSVNPSATPVRAIAGALAGLAATDEVWIIAKHTETQVVIAPDQPGQGQLLAKVRENQAEKMIPVPLKHTDVKASIVGYLASVDVQQQYQNPYSEKIEAVYVFPLPENAAVNEFVMTVGSRRIRGIIRERQEAEQIYQQARAQGYVASLLTQERPNVFTPSVANIEPGKEIDIDIQYFSTLKYADGAYEFVFPMVVGPRFNPPGYSNGIAPVSRQTPPGMSSQKTAVPYLAPDERSGHDISLAVELNAGVPLDHVDCRNHNVTMDQATPGKTVITLNEANSIPNRDFVLRFQLAGKGVKQALIAQQTEHGGYFTLMLFPPAMLSDLPRQPLEFVFTIDVSGSQSGAPLAQEKAATRFALTHMNAGDTFQVIRFGNTAKRFFPTPQPATPANVQAALQWVDGFDAVEGTMLIDGVHAALLFPPDPTRARHVVFLTDGFIGNDTEAIAEVHKCLGPAHLFSFGVGSSTNRYLLEGMARMGRGAAAYLGLNDDASVVMAQYFDRVSHPALRDITLDWTGANVHDVYPAQVPDLYVGRPVIITGRYEGALPKTVSFQALVGGQIQRFEVPVQQADAKVDGRALPAVWARMKITDLADHAALQGGIDLPSQIRQLALEYNLMSAYTAFVAVDSLTRTAGDHGVSVNVPVAVPAGVRYDTTVQNVEVP
jgi:Ca-activated chloride channel family protein